MKLVRNLIILRNQELPNTLNIETLRPIYHVEPGIWEGLGSLQHKNQLNSYKSVRFAEDSMHNNSQNLNYSLTEELTIGSEEDSKVWNDNSKLSFEDLSSIRKNKYPYKKKSK